MSSANDRRLSISELTLARDDPKVEDEEHCLSAYGSLSPVKSPRKRTSSVLGSGANKPMPPSKMRRLTIVQSHEYRKSLLSARRYLPRNTDSSGTDKPSKEYSSPSSNLGSAGSATRPRSESLRQATNGPNSSRIPVATGSHSKYHHPDYKSPKRPRRRWDEKRNAWVLIDVDTPSALPKRTLGQVNQEHKSFKLGGYGLSASLPPSFKFE